QRCAAWRSSLVVRILKGPSHTAVVMLWSMMTWRFCLQMITGEVQCDVAVCLCISLDRIDGSKANHDSSRDHSHKLGNNQTFFIRSGLCGVGSVIAGTLELDGLLRLRSALGRIDDNCRRTNGMEHAIGTAIIGPCLALVNRMYALGT